MAWWYDTLRAKLATANKAAVARELGWPETRISNMLGRQAIPNAVDAVILCRFVGLKADDVFDPKNVPPKPKPPVKSPLRRKAVERVAAAAVGAAQRRRDRADKVQKTG